MKITVTEEDIQNGRRGRPDSCPVALAIKRSFLSENIPVNCVNATPALIRWRPYKGSLAVVRDTPQSVRNFIHDFDDNSIVSTFSFHLSPHAD